MDFYTIHYISVRNTKNNTKKELYTHTSMHLAFALFSNLHIKSWHVKKDVNIREGPAHS